jgi:hypothetical protein
VDNKTPGDQNTFFPKGWIVEMPATLEKGGVASTRALMRGQGIYPKIGFKVSARVMTMIFSLSSRA